MILEFDEVKQRIKKPANKMLGKAVTDYNKLQLHVNGVGVQQALQRFVEYENQGQKDLRDKVTKSMRHIYSSLLRPTDKVFSAKGGSVYYNLTGQAEQRFNDILSNIIKGMSLRNWMKNYWKNKYISDPNGLIMLEIGDNNIYPTYKSITSIHDCKVNGNHCEYVIFKAIKKEDEKGKSWMEENKEYYRVIDDAYDAMYRKDGDEITLIEDQTFENYMGTVPAFTCSDLIDDTCDIKTSIVDETLELADECLSDGSVHSAYKYLHGYPLFWMYLQDCPHCQGVGKLEGETCGFCKGTGKDLKKDISKVYGLVPPRGDEAKIAPDIAGFVQPDLNTWSKQMEELDWLRVAMNYTMWGTHQSEKADNETATARFLDVQPVNDRQNIISDSAEMLEQQLTNLIGQFHFGINYGGASISYGRRFMMESPDEIWNKYQDARKNGSPRSTLDYLLLQFYQVEFSNQPMQLAKQKKLMRIEPFIHLTEKQVKELDLPNDSYYRKIYYSDWAKSLDDNMAIFDSEESLQNKFSQFIILKLKENESTSVENNA